MEEIKKIELITEIEADNKTVLFNHIQENEAEFEEVKLNIKELDSKLQNIQLTPGEQGEKGDKGETGERGESGRDGIDGKDGKDGVDGVNGLDGKDGESIRGEKGDKGDKPKHRWKATKLQFEKPDGTWGQLVDLRGLQGQIGLPNGSLGASYPSVHLNNNLITTGVRDLNFEGSGVDVQVSGTKVNVSITGGDLSGYVPYTGATGDVNLGSNGIGGGAAAFSSLSLDNFYIDGNTLQTVLASLVLDSTGYDIDLIGNNFTWGASSGADSMVFNNQYLTLTSSASDNGIYIDNTATTGDPFIAFKISGTVFGSIGIRDSDSDALYITAGATFSSKNIKLTTSNTEFFRMLLMNKAAIVEAQAALPTGATPSAAGANVFTTANSGATSITNFTAGTTGQTIKLIGADGGNTTVTDTANILLAGSANFVLGDDDTLVLYYNGSRWLELSRSNN